MTVDPMREHVQAVLAHFQHTATPIPEGDGETADLHAVHGADQWVVEVKSRIDDEDLERELRAQDVGTVVGDSRTIGRTATMDRVLHKAKTQIVASQKSYPGLGLHWFCRTPKTGISSAGDEMRATLLGLCCTFYKTGDGESKSGWVTFGRFTAFHKYPEIDAVVLDQGNGHFSFLVNPFSPRRTAVRETRLHALFAEGGGVEDVELIESAEPFFIVRGDFSRADEAHVLNALNEQHPGYEFIRLFDMRQHRSITTVEAPRD